MRAKKLTHQQILNRAVLGVVRQGALSSVEGSCSYRMTKDGKTLACGIGQLLDPDTYSHVIEGVTAEQASPERWGDLRKREVLGLALILSGVDVTDDQTVELIDRIQTAHDGAANLPGFIWSAERVAHDFGLQIPRVPTALLSQSA